MCYVILGVGSKKNYWEAISLYYFWGKSSKTLPWWLFSWTTHSDSGQETLRHVGHDDANEEDDGLQPAVAQDERQHEEGDTQKHSHPCDQLDEMFDLHGYGRPPNFQAWGQSGYAAHHRPITCGNDDAPSSAWNIGEDTRLNWSTVLLSEKGKPSWSKWAKDSDPGVLVDWLTFPA